MYILKIENKKETLHNWIRNGTLLLIFCAVINLRNRVYIFSCLCCVVFVCLFSCLLSMQCVQYCPCLCIVNSRLRLRFSVTFIFVCILPASDYHMRRYSELSGKFYSPCFRAPVSDNEIMTQYKCKITICLTSGF
jgi:hypothetical protein